MPTTYDDGEILSDSFELTIATQTYIVNSLTLTNPVLEIGRNGVEGARAATRYVADQGTGSIELQINTSAQNQSLQFEEVTIPATHTITGLAYVVVLTEETQNVASGTVRTRTFTVKQKQNIA